MAVYDAVKLAENERRQRARNAGPELAAMLAKVTQSLRIRIEDTNEDALQDDLDDNHVTAAEALLREIGWKW